MFVEMVTAPKVPARATTGASSASFFAFSTSHANPGFRERQGQAFRVGHRGGAHENGPARRVRLADLRDDGALLRVPSVNSASSRSIRAVSRCIGITTTSSP